VLQHERMAVARTPEGVADELYYSNPFWSDPTAPESDKALLELVAVRNQGKAQIHRRWFKALPIYVGIPAFFFVVGLEFLGYLAVFLALTWPIAYLADVAGPIDDPRLKEQVAAASRERYSRWLRTVQRRDPHYHAQLLLWEQNHRSIALQRLNTRLQQQQLQEQRSMARDMDDLKRRGLKPRDS
jgi:hypothetical protein